MDLYRVYISVPEDYEAFWAAVKLLRKTFVWELPFVKTYLEHQAGWYKAGVLMNLGVFTGDEVALMVLALEKNLQFFETPDVKLDPYPVMGE